MTVFEWDGWVFETAEWRLTSVSGGPVALSNKSLELLALLLERAPSLVSKDDILSAVWPDTVVEEGNIAFHVAMLRRALDTPGSASCIETVRGRGYRFTAPVLRRSPVAAPPHDRQVGAPAEATEVSAAPIRRWRMAHVLPVVLIALAVSFTGWVAATAPDDSAHPEAITLTMRARESWRLRTPPSIQQAIALYERAIAIDPEYAPAYAGLADCYNLTMSGLPTDVRATRAKANAERAAALDPGLAEAQTSLAFYRYKFEWNWVEAEAAFRRAIAANPSYALAHHWYGEMLGLLGRYDEAIAALRQAQALDPGSLAIKSDLVSPLLRSGRLAEARAIVEAGAAINPTFYWIPRRMAEVLAAEGRERESLEQEWRAMILSGATIESVEALREAYREGGLQAVLRLEIARLESGGNERFTVQQQATSLASRYARLGDRDKALHWIGVAIDRREDIALHLLTYPEYDALRGDPEFQRQLARAGLTSARRR